MNDLWMKVWRTYPEIRFMLELKDVISDAPPPLVRHGISLRALVERTVRGSTSSDVRALIALSEELIRLADIIEDIMRESLDAAMRGIELVERVVAEVKRMLIEVRESHSSSHRSGRSV